MICSRCFASAGVALTKACLQGQYQPWPDSSTEMQLPCMQLEAELDSGNPNQVENAVNAAANSVAISTGGGLWPEHACRSLCSSVLQFVQEDLNTRLLPAW